MNTIEDVEFDYQTYMKKCMLNIVEIHRGPETHQKRRDAAIHNNRGIACRDKGEIDRAIENFTKAIELNPDLAIAYSNRGVAYGEKGDIDRAIADFTEAIELQPDFADAYYNRGIAYHEKREYDRAIVDYTMTIGLKPDLVEAYNNRGNAYSERREFVQSIKDYSKTIELKPQLAEAYYNRGEAWLHLGEWEEAKSDLTDARSMGINIITAFDYLYESVADFEQSNGVKLPEYIAEMLTPQVIATRRADLQQQVIELVEQLSAEKLQVIIDYLTGLQDKEGWEATLELAGDPEIAKSLERAEADVKAGRLKHWDDVRRDV